MYKIEWSLMKSVGEKNDVFINVIATLIGTDILLMS